MVTNSASFDGWAKSFGKSKQVEHTGFLENWEASWGQVAREDRTFSRNATLKNALAERKMQVWEYLNTANDPELERTLRGFQKIESNYTDLQYGLITDYLKDKKGVTHIRTDKEIMAGIRADLKSKRDDDRAVFEKQTGMGWLGMMGGSFGSILVDPVYLPTYFVGVGAYAKGAQVLKAMLRVAAVEGGMEMVKQPSVYSWKEDIGVDYSLEDAVVQVAVAASVAAGLTGTVGAVRIGLKKLASKATKSKIKMTAEQEMAYEMNNSNIDELSQAPDKDMNIKEYQSIVEGEQVHQLNRNKAASPEDIAEAKEVDELYPELDEEFSNITEVDPEAKSYTGNKIMEGQEEVIEKVNAKLKNDVLIEKEEHYLTLLDCARMGLI